MTWERDAWDDLVLKKVTSVTIAAYSEPAASAGIDSPEVKGVHVHTYGADNPLQSEYTSLGDLERDLRNFGIYETGPVRDEWKRAEERARAKATQSGPSTP